MLKARDAMTKNPTSVYEDTPISEAMQLLIERDITGLPVVDADMRVVGVVSERDMLNLLYNMPHRPRKVREILTREVVAFDIDDDLFEICETLINNRFRRVPILQDGKLVGVISRQDIIRYILKVRKGDKPAPEEA